MGISREQALDCLRSDDLVGIGMEADAVRRKLHPEGVVSYVLAGCVDCAAVLDGSAGGDSSGADSLFEGVCDEVGATVERGATGVRILSRMNPGVGLDAAGLDAMKLGATNDGAANRDARNGRANPGGANGSAADGMARLNGWEGLLRGVRRRFPVLWVEGLSVAEVAALTEGCGLGLGETLARLRGAGMDSIGGAISGDGAAVELQEWLGVHRAAHAAEMRTAAAMVFAAGETLEQRVDFLEAVRRLQEETGGFSSFVAVAADAPGGRELDGATAVERLKMLAVSRMFLDNIENVQSSRAGQGLKVLQTGLRFGANDVGAVDAGEGKDTGEEDLRRMIRDAGFKPVERDALYRTMFLN